MPAPPSRVLHLVAPPTSGVDDLALRDDDELMRLAKMGHAAAFGVLVRRHSHALVQLVAKLTADAGFAEEVAQDVWLAIWRGRSSYVSGDFRAYLITAARNRCRNRARSLGRRGPALEALAVEPAPQQRDQLDALLERELAEELLGALGALRDAEREAIVLRYAEDLDYETMESLTATKSSTLRARVHHGLLALRARLTRERTSR